MSALTTTFTPAPSCTSDFYTVTDGNYYSIGGASANINDCFPSSWKSLSQFYSPGVCPQGYTQACSALSASGTVTETRATCCPLNYQCYTGVDFNFPGQACVSIFGAVETTLAIDAVALTTEIVTLHPRTEAVNGFGVSIRYKAADFISSTSSNSAPSSTTTTSGGPSNSSPTSSNPSSTSSNSPAAQTSASSGLSTAAKAGIGIGVGVLALLAIIGLVIFFVRKRKMQQQSHYPLLALADPSVEHGAPRYGAEVKQPMANPQELYVHVPPAEMDSSQYNKR